MLAADNVPSLGMNPYVCISSLLALKELFLTLNHPHTNSVLEKKTWMQEMGKGLCHRSTWDYVCLQPVPGSYIELRGQSNLGFARQSQKLGSSSPKYPAPLVLSRGRVF